MVMVACDEVVKMAHGLAEKEYVRLKKRQEGAGGGWQTLYQFAQTSVDLSTLEAEMVRRGLKETPVEEETPSENSVGV